MPTLTVQPTGGTYNTLNAALAAAVNNDTIEIINDWSSVTDTTAAIVADTGITIKTVGVARHKGVDNAGSNYELAVDGVAAGSHCITVNGTGCTIDGLLILQTGTGVSHEGIRVAATDLTVKNCIIRAANKTDQQDGVYFANLNMTFTAEQCCFCGFGRAGIHAQNFSGASDYALKINSCGFWDNGNTTAFGGGLRVQTAGGTKTVDVYNTWALANTTGSSAADFIQVGASAITWGISRSIDSDNSIVGLDSGGIGNLASRTIREATAGGDEVLVIDITTSPFDIRLVDDGTTDGTGNNDAQNRHASGTGEGITIPGTDVAGTIRPQNTNYDIGAFEVLAAGGPSGTAIQTLPKLTQAGSGIQTFSATAAQTLATLLQTGTGTQGTIGTATQTLAALIQTGNGLLVFTATASSMLAALIQSGVGVMLPSGTAAQTLASLLQDAVGTQGVSATSIQTLPAVSQSSVGVMLPSGTSSLILASLLQSASGAVATQGTGAQTLASIIQSGTGLMLPSGTSAQILASLTQAAVGESRLVGTGANILAAIQQAAVGIETFPGSGVLTLPSIIQAGTGQLLIIATASQILPAITQVASEAALSTIAGGVVAGATYIISIDANALYGSIVAEPKTNLQ